MNSHTFLVVLTGFCCLVASNFIMLVTTWPSMIWHTPVHRVLFVLHMLILNPMLSALMVAVVVYK